MCVSIVCSSKVNAQLCATPDSINPTVSYDAQWFHSKGTSTSIQFLIRAHVIRDGNGQGGITIEEITEGFDLLKSTFSTNGVAIDFILDPCIVYIEDQNLYDNGLALLGSNQFFSDPTLSQSSDAIDLYLLPSGYNGGGATEGVGVSAKVAVAGDAPGTQIPAITTNILSHEMGHIFGLRHTFHFLGGACGNVPGFTWREQKCCLGNGILPSFGEPAGQAQRMAPSPFDTTKKVCELTGDRICETPADPSSNFNTSSQLVTRQTCPCTGSNLFDCSNVDWNNHTYNPLPTNIMDYLPASFLLDFIPEQAAVMYDNATVKLPHLVSRIYTPTTPTTISGTVIINTPVDYDTDVIVPSGATLQVTPGGILRFAPGKGIIVQSGGNLVSNGGVFTKLDCASVDSWKGIKIFENSELSLTGESIVEYAEVGVDLLHEFNSTLLPDIEINQATFTHCGTAVSYYSTVGVSPTPSQLVLNDITIDQCGTGFTSVWADGYKITNTVVSDCTVGVEIYNSRGVEVIAGAFDACEEGVNFFNSETPQLSDLTFTACADGVALDFVDGALIDDCSFQDITNIATHLYNSDATITSSNYTDCTAGVVIDGTGFGIDPSTIGESGGSNFFLNVDQAVNLHGAMTSVRHDIQNNYFEDCYLSMLVNGLSTCRLQNNDVFYGDVGTAVVNTGDQDNLIQYNSLSSVAASPSISVFTTDETRYLYNCYSDNPYRDIHVYLSSIADNQWRNPGVASGNEFSKIDGVPSIDVGLSQSFNYYVLDEHYVNPASVYYPNFEAGQGSPQGYVLDEVGEDEPSDCGSGSNIQPPSSTCNCAKSSEENWAILTQLYADLTEVENNENLDEVVKTYQIRKLEICIARIWRCILWWDYDSKGLGDQGEDWVTDTDTVDISSIRVLAVQLLLRRRVLSTVTNYLTVHMGGFGVDGIDFETLIPLSIQQYTSDSLSTSDLLTIEAIATDSSTFSGLASAMYYQATGIRLLPQWGESLEERSSEDSLNQKNEKLAIFPNPVSDLLSVEAEWARSNEVCRIFDVTGKTLLESKLVNRTVDVTELPNGLYILQVGDDTAKFVKI